jgi:vancomycin resistance protein YoaR
MSKSLTENDPKTFNKSKEIVQKFFNKSTEIHREFRLINALVNESVGSPEHATLILEEVRKTASRFDGDTLVKEKFELVKEVNESLGGKSFYDFQIENYTLYATAATMVKYWRGEKSLDVTTAIKYQKMLAENLSKLRLEAKVETDSTIDPLVVKIMTEKVNQKYGSNLTGEQKEILQSYMLQESSEDFKQKLNAIKKNTITLLKDYAGSSSSETVKENSRIAEEKIKKLNTSELSDETVKKFLEVSKLKHELIGE